MVDHREIRGGVGAKVADGRTRRTSFMESIVAATAGNPSVAWLHERY